MDRGIMEESNGIECSECEGTGIRKPKTSRGRVTTYTSDTCTKCSGRGRLYPVSIELEPAETRAEAQSG